MNLHDNYDWLALPGIPAGSGAWERLPVRTMDFEGVQNDQVRQNWQLDSLWMNYRRITTATPS